GDRLRHADNLDEAHAAVAGDRQALVVTEARNGDPDLLASLDQRQAVLDLDKLPVDDDLFRHFNLSNPTKPPRSAILRSSRCLSPGSKPPLAPALVVAWIPGTRPGMTFGRAPPANKWSVS